MSIIALATTLALFAQFKSNVTTQSPHPADVSRGDSFIALARNQPDSLRAAISRAYSVAASTPDSRVRFTEILRARRLAEGYQRAWSDPFLVRQVWRFEKMSQARRGIYVLADSLRRSGIAAMSRDGVPTAMRLWREGLRRAAFLGDASLEGPALLAIGAGFFRLGELDSATAYVTKARDIAVRINDQRTTGNAFGILASIKKDNGELSAATELYRRASAVRARSGDSRGIAADENNVALIAQERGDSRAAAASFERALRINRHDGRPTLVALNLTNLAGVAANTGDYARADSLYREALALHRRNGDRAETAFVLQGLGKVLTNRGEYHEATLALTEALQIHDASGAVMEAIQVRTDLAALQSAAGDPERALTTLEKASVAASTTNAPPESRAALALAKGDLAIQFGTFADADAEYLSAERFSRLGADSSGIAQALQGRAMLLHWRDNDLAALRLLDQAGRIQRATGDKRSAAVTRLVVADIQMERGELATSRKTLLAARETLGRLGDAVGEAEALGALGQLSLRQGS
ncbi:MAG: tetratricopeptide repeat protein, partial [Gemmatimonadales bacterium]